MKQIKLKKLELRNFKGIKHFEMEFDRGQNFVFGKNGSGKTTLFDAFTWLLFGKDSEDRADYNIKNTVDTSLNRQDHEVTAILHVDDEEIEIKRIYAEKWVKQRGDEEATLQGHKTSFFWNGTPMKQIDFNKEVAEICDEFVFKLITSPYAFNALNWKDRRDILMKMAGDVSDQDVAGGNKAYLDLIEKMKKYKSADDYRKMLLASVKKAKEEIKAIPSRIDEVHRSRPVPPAVTFDKIRQLIDGKRNEIDEVDQQLADSTKAYQAELEKINQHNRKIQALKTEIFNIKSEAEREAQKQSRKDTTKLDDATYKVHHCEREIEALKKGISDVERSVLSDQERADRAATGIEARKKEWYDVNAEECGESTVCPTCQQEFPEHKISDILERFNSNKADRLAQINAQGKHLSEEKSYYEKQVQAGKEKIEEARKVLEEKEQELSVLTEARDNEKTILESQETVPLSKLVEDLLASDEALQIKVKELSTLESSVPESPHVDNKALKDQKIVLQAELDKMKSDLLKEDQMKQADARVRELEDREKELAQQIANVERDVFAIEEFTKLKTEEINRRVHDKFKYVAFRMFRDQINGGTDPVCDILVSGVPFPAANTAGKINAGIDIINALSSFYGVSAPVFIDNRESVTDIIDTESQIINLMVSPLDKVLRIDQLLDATVTTR